MYSSCKHECCKVSMLFFQICDVGDLTILALGEPGPTVLVISWFFFPLASFHDVGNWKNWRFPFFNVILNKNRPRIGRNRKSFGTTKILKQTFFRFVMYVGWPSSTRGVSQTWWGVKEGSEKSWDTPFFFLGKLGKFAPEKNLVWYNINSLANFLTVGGWVTGTKGFFTRGLGQIWPEVKERCKKKLGFSLYKLGASWNLFVLIWQFHNFFLSWCGELGVGPLFFPKKDPLYHALSTLLIFSHQIAKIGDKNSNTGVQW